MQAKSALRQLLLFSRSISERPAGLDNSLLFAYTYCLPVADLHTLVISQITETASLVRPLRSALKAVGEGGKNVGQLDELAESLMRSWQDSGKYRYRVDSYLNLLYQYLSPQEREKLLEFWLSRGTRGSARRWFKAITNDELHRSTERIWDYWINSGDVDAAKEIAYRSEPDFLRGVIFHLMTEDIPGWIGSKALIRLNCEDTTILEEFRRNHPGSYLYVCAKLDRKIDEGNALETLLACGAGLDGDIDLALWALGRMGHLDALKRFEREFLEEYKKNEIHSYVQFGSPE